MASSVQHRGWWVGSRLLFLAGVAQVFAAGLLVFAGDHRVHPGLGYVLGLGVLIQAVSSVVTSHRRHLAGPALLALFAVVAAPVTVLVGPSIGALAVSAHPVVGFVLVLAQYELMTRVTMSH